MKRKALIIIFIISTLLLSFMFSSCIKKPNGETPEPPIEYTDFYDLDAVAFSYNDTEKGFQLYDDFELDTINLKKFVDKQKTTAELFLGKEKIELNFVGFGNFGKYRFDKVGNYGIKIKGEAKDGTPLNGEFEFFVRNQGLPDEFQYNLINNEGNNIAFVEGGQTAFLDATIKLNNEIMLADTNVFSSYWKEGKNKGLRRLEINKGNTVFDTEENIGFFIEITNNIGKKVVIENIATVVVKNNLLTDSENSTGIYMDFGGQYAPERTVYSKGSLSAIDSNLSAEYRFKNGDVVPLVYSDRPGEYNFKLMVRYNGESEFTKYSVDDYDYSKNYRGEDIYNYIPNGTRYYFNPLKDSVEIRPCVWVGTKMEGMTLYDSVLIDNTTTITLTKSLPTSISIEKVEANERNDIELSYNGVKKSIYPVVHNTVTVKIACSLNYLNHNDVDLRQQNFSFSLKFNPECDMKDFEYTISGDLRSPAVQSHKWKVLGGYEKVFVARNVGQSVVTIKSKFSNAEYSLTVNVVDPILEEELYANVIPNVFTKVELRPYVKVRQYKLSTNPNDDAIIRSLREDEVLIYAKEEINNNWTDIELDSLTYTNMPTNGYKISLRCKLSGKWQSSLIVKNVRIIPNLSFGIDGGDEIWLYSIENDSYSYMRSGFWGIIPQCECGVDSISEFELGKVKLKVEDYGDINVDDRQHLSISYDFSNHYIVIKFTYFTYNRGQIVSYTEMEILKINIVQK